MNEWTYQGNIFEYDGASFGFVYQITNRLNGMRYLGRKYFTKAGYKTVKGKRKKIRLESDWKEYHGSSPKLKADVEQYGPENFDREILKLCESRGECSYWETQKIFESEALLDPMYYNEVVQCRINKTHIKNLIK